MTGRHPDNSAVTAMSCKEAARLAATRHATDAALAVTLFAELTGRSLSLGEVDREELEEEMCALLPVYRTPVHDENSEYILFFDPDGQSTIGDGQSEATSVMDRGQQAYRAYVRLVRGGGLSRRLALARVRKQFAYPNDQAALRALTTEMNAVSLRWQQSAPCMVQTLLDTRWQGLLPDL